MPLLTATEFQPLWGCNYCTFREQPASYLRQGKDRCPPGRLIEVQSVCLQIVAIPFVSGASDQIMKLPFFVAEIREGKEDIALALIESIVHRHQFL